MAEPQNVARAHNTIVPSAGVERRAARRKDATGLVAYCALVASVAIAILVIVGYAGGPQ